MKHLCAGLICAGLGAWGIITWWDVFGLVMRGVVPFLLLMVGLIAILAGYRRSGQAMAVPVADPAGAGPAAATPAAAPAPAMPAQAPPSPMTPPAAAARQAAADAEA